MKDHIITDWWRSLPIREQDKQAKLLNKPRTQLDLIDITKLFNLVSDNITLTKAKVWLTTLNKSQVRQLYILNNIKEVTPENQNEVLITLYNKALEFRLMLNVTKYLIDKNTRQLV